MSAAAKASAPKAKPRAAASSSKRSASTAISGSSKKQKAGVVTAAVASSSSSSSSAPAANSNPLYHSGSDDLKMKKGARLAGKVALVTGAGGAIGRMIARILAAHGANVAVGDINKAAAEETVRCIQQDGGKASASVFDVSSEDQVKQWIDAVAARWDKIDILVNNAVAFVFGELLEVSGADWAKCLDVNVKGYAYTIKHAIPHFKKAGGGAIANIASISSFIAQPKFTPYNTSKGAILQLTRCVAMDYGKDNIRCNAICPGTIDTPATDKHAKKVKMTKQALTAEVLKGHFVKRLGHPRDVANAVAFLVSEESSFISGTTLVVDGGAIAHA